MITGVNNSIRGNAIFQNGQLGIDLGLAGVTANDAGDPDGNGNNQQNFPVLSATPGSVLGMLNSTPNTTFVAIWLLWQQRLRCVGARRGRHVPGDGGRGDRRRRQCRVAGRFATTGLVITSTATDVANNTSEFSNCIQVTGALALTVDPASGQQGQSFERIADR